MIIHIYVIKADGHSMQIEVLLYCQPPTTKTKLPAKKSNFNLGFKKSLPAFSGGVGDCTAS